MESPTRRPNDNEGRSASAVARRPQRGSSTPKERRGDGGRRDRSVADGAGGDMATQTTLTMGTVPSRSDDRFAAACARSLSDGDR
jgi:hypothetical protein